jgi:hypothetical protein
MLIGLMVAWIAAPAVAVAGGSGQGCSLLGTWFGIDPAAQTLTGWMVTVQGSSNNEGTNVLEFPTFDVTLGGAFPAAYGSTSRGWWRRTGGNTFEYSFMSIATDYSRIPVWIGVVSGNIEISSDCTTETITAGLAVFLPDMSPFEDEPVLTLALPTHYGRRYGSP